MHATLDFTGSPLAGKGAWHLLPAVPTMPPTATKHFDRLQISQETSKITLNYEWLFPVGGFQSIFFDPLFQGPLVIIAKYDLQQCEVTEGGIYTGNFYYDFKCNLKLSV